MNKPLDAMIALLENFTVSAWILDEEQKIVYMNGLMEEWFGDLIGQSAAILYENAIAPADERSNMPESAEGGVSEVTISDVPFRRMSSAVDFGADGKYNVELFEDISEQKHVHDQMIQALTKLKKETKTAKIIQNSILPIDDTYWNTIAYSSLYIPADDLGGDFYDLLKLNDDEYIIYIADVAGHGIQASLLTVFMCERMRSNTEAALVGTGELLSKLVRDFSALDIDGSVYVTMALCKYTKSRRELSISNAGHNCFPLIVRKSGRTEAVPTRGMPICAIAEGQDYDEEIVSMNPGDRLILYTDGIVEEVDSTGASFGTEGVRKLAEKNAEYSGNYLARTIMDESARFALINAKDDRTVIVADILS